MALSARVRIPRTARAGETVEIRTLTRHPMETGYRRDHDGARVPRHIVESLRCTYDGRVVFDAELRPAIAANPYLAFTLVADRSGEIVLEWRDDRGETFEARGFLEVTP